MSTAFSSLSRDEQRDVLLEVERIQQEKKRDDELEKRNLARGSKAGTYEVVSDGGVDLNRIYTDLVLGERLPLPKKAQPGDLFELAEGCWIPPDHIARRLSEEEAAQADAEGRVTLQAMARLRAVEAPVIAAEGALRRTDGEIVNAEGIVAVAQAKVESLKDERERAALRLEAAQTAREKFFSGRSAEWRDRAIAETARRDRPLPTPPPETAKAHFAPRPDGGKEFTINKVTGERERVR